MHCEDHRSRIPVVLGLTIAATACSGKAAQSLDQNCASNEHPTAGRNTAVYGGTPATPYLAIAAAQANAVIRLEFEVPGRREPGICSGVLVSPQVVVTAKHCASGLAAPSLRVLVPGDGDRASHAVEFIELHPERDLAALKLEAEAASRLAAAALPVVAVLDDNWIGRRAVLAGYGLNDTGEPEPSRLFAVQEIASVASGEVMTLDNGFSGGCSGDSGGPLLARDAAGNVVVLGILSSGSVTCRGFDRFARLDDQREWLVRIGAESQLTQDCGELSFEGRCFDGLAVWCEQDRIRSAKCGEAEACGWSGALSAYRCVEAFEACSGADTFGACTAGSAIHCSAGVAATEPCASCGKRCGFDSRSGRAACFRL
jgi:hypothetical protein